MYKNNEHNVIFVHAYKHRKDWKRFLIKRIMAIEEQRHQRSHENATSTTILVHILATLKFAQSIVLYVQREGEKGMRDTIISVFSLSLIALIVLSAIAGPLVFSGFPPRSYNGPGLGYATFYVTPQDSNFTSPANGTWFKIQIRMENFTHVYSWQYQLIFKNDLLTSYPENVTEVAGADYVFAGKARTSLSVVVDAFNATHTRILAFQSLQGATPPVAGADKGVTDVWLKIIKDPDVGNTLSTLLFFKTDMTGLTDDTFTIDEGGSNENDCTMKDGYYENAYAGRLIDVFVGTGTGPYPAPNGGQGQDKVAGAFEPQNPVCAYALVTYNGDPVQSKLVTFIIISPSGLHDFSRTATTNATGYAYIEFNIPWPTADPYAEIYGTWNMTVKVDIRDVVVEDTVWFKVIWQNPTASKTHSPDIPLIYEVATFNASASVGYRNVLGVLTPDPTYIATYTWDFGDGSPIVTVGTPIITHAYANMGNYTVILTVTDLNGRNGTVSQEVKVILGRLIDVFVGSGTGAYPAPYGGQGPSKVADMFEPQKTVCVYANVTYNGDAVQSKLVTFIVLSPHNLHDFSRTAVTNSTGYAYIEFGLPWPCVDPVNEIFGIWNITVKVDIRSQVVEDTVAFKVWWSIEMTSVVPKATEFVKGGYACFDITFRTYRMQPIDGVLEITLYDDLDVPFAATRIEYEGVGWGNYTWCMFKNYTVTICLDVPKWAFVGQGTAYVNFFHHDITNPYNMGSPYCPDAHATFTILKAP